MVNVFRIVRPIFHGLMKLAGLTPQTIEIEPGTLMHIWVPKQTVIITDAVYAPPTKPAVLLVHSFAVDGAFTWLFQVLALSGEYSVYVPDLLFFGGSITDKPQRSADFQAEFLAKGLWKLGVDRCRLVGISYGGMIGFKMAKMYPDLVESMVVTATVIELTESISQNAYRRLGLSRWSDLLLPETVEGLKRMLSIGTHQLPWLPDFFYRHFLEVFFTNRKERGELLEALVVADVEDANATNIDYPQTINLLWGDDDKIFNRDITYNIKEKLGDKSTLHFIKNAGHLVPLERSSAYNDKLKYLLSSSCKHGE